jgi:hypothetical protein
MIGILHHCLTTRTNYDEDIAFPHPKPRQAPQPQRLDTLSAWDVSIASDTRH